METIGLVGLGIMGKPMARNLLRAGYPLVVHNRSHSAVDELVALGARAADSPKQVAQDSDIMITMLPDSETVERVVAGASGLLAGARQGALIIDMSSIRPRTSRALAEQAKARGVAMLDAPVSGGEVGAQNATLSIMVGGSAEAYARALPIFQVLGKNIGHVGGAGAGQITKAANQTIVALTIEAVAEALTLVAKAGGDPALARQVMLGGFASSRILELHGERMLTKQFAPGARVRSHHKDLQIALDLAEQSGAPMPLARQVDEMFVELIQRGLGDQDHSVLITLFQDLGMDS
jgi:2-hydroxy-3-oxopropionate reductase